MRQIVMETLQLLTTSQWMMGAGCETPLPIYNFHHLLPPAYNTVNYLILSLPLPGRNTL